MALVVFLCVAATVSGYVHVAARRAADAARAGAEADSLVAMAATLGAADPLPALVSQLVDTFELDGAAVLRPDTGGWVQEVTFGATSARPARDCDARGATRRGCRPRPRGSGLTSGEHVVLKAFSAQLTAVIDRRRLRAEAGRAEVLAQGERVAGSLQAVSHDLRTPLAAIKASATSLSQNDISWSRDEILAFARTIDEETDRLTALVGNLLDMSRIQAGALQPSTPGRARRSGRGSAREPRRPRRHRRRRPPGDTRRRPGGSRAPGEGGGQRRGERHPVLARRRASAGGGGLVRRPHRPPSDRPGARHPPRGP